MIFGPDVSDWQGTVDWAAVRASGRLLGFAKATEGTGYVADTLAANRTGMERAGLVLRGLYHFARPDRSSAADEAAHFLAAVGTLRAGEVAVLDLESGNIGHTATGAWARAWLEAVEAATGRKPWVYSYAPFLAVMDTADLTAYPLWIAGYGRNDGQVPNDAYRPGTDRWDRAVLWQYTSNASVPGISGRCDDNVFEGTEAELVALAGGAAPKVPEVPVAGLDHQHPTFAARITALCRATGCTVYSGARSTEEQAELYRRWKAGTGSPANPPGYSWHEFGPDLTGGPWACAVDLDGDLDAANALGESYGIAFPVAGEQWHAQPVEIRNSARGNGDDQASIPTLPIPPTSEEDNMLRFIFAGQDWVFPGPGRGELFATSSDGQLAALDAAGVPAIGEVDQSANDMFMTLGRSVGR